MLSYVGKLWTVPSFDMPFHPFEARVLLFALYQLFSSSALGTLLCRALIKWTLFKLSSAISFIPYIPFYLFVFFSDSINTQVRPAVSPTLSRILHPHRFACPTSPIRSRSSEPIDHLPSLRLLSKDRKLPMALNSHLQRSDFDPDFVAALLSRQQTQQTTGRHRPGYGMYLFNYTRS